MIPPITRTTHIPKQLPKKVEAINKGKRDSSQHKGQSFKDILKAKMNESKFDKEA